MLSQEVVEAQLRPQESRGKNEARRVRAQGRVPAVVYGARQETAVVTVDPKQISRILHSESGHNTIFDLQLGGGRTKAMIVDWQSDPVAGSLLHVDFKRIAMDQRLQVTVPVLLKGEAAGVKTQGGILEQTLREVEIECLPGDIPSHIDLDVTELVFGMVLRVADLPQSGSVRFVTDQNIPVAHIVAVKEVEAAPAAEAAAAEAAPAEPEVIKKGKQETAEEGAAPAAEGKAEKSEKKEKK
jgi:large subunit ribosomal protein L25